MRRLFLRRLAESKESRFRGNSKRSIDLKETPGEAFTFFHEKRACCKPNPLNLFLVFIICGSLLTLIQSPLANQSGHPDQNIHSSRISESGWIWNHNVPGSIHRSYTEVDWTQISKSIDKLNATRDDLRIALLNFNLAEVSNWQKLLPGVRSSALPMVPVNSSLTWEDFYPEWIDEEEESEVPLCPSLLQPGIENPSQCNFIAVKLPCNQSGEWSKDVSRLYLQISAAKLAAAAQAQNPVHVLFVTGCFPIPNLFRCKDLVAHEGDTWVYKPDLQVLNEKLRLPVGSCQLAVPLKTKGRLNSVTTRREAYVTILHSEHVYVCGAIVVAQSIRMTGSTRDLVILVDEKIRDHHRSGLELAGWKVRTIKRIRNPKAERDAYNKYNYSKFRLWQLTDYDKIIFIDADLIILRNIDFLFSMPEITATGNNGTMFNSGVMVIEPSNCTFQLLMDHIHEIESYNGGDQGFLNEVFTWWHRMPRHMNFLKHFWEGDEDAIKQMKTSLFGADPPILYVLHYLGIKPWLCYRDYDCNWNVDKQQEFASDVAHGRWWKVHDAMPERLRQFCVLRPRQKAMLEWDRMQAMKGNYSDGHWRWKIGGKNSDLPKHASRMAKNKNITIS